MPSDDYAGFVPGALKLKGAKVTKPKKKKSSKASKEAELAISTAASATSKKERRQKSQSPNGADEDEDADQKVAISSSTTTTTMYRTKAEQAREETQRRRMLKMMEPGKVKPDLLKTHKERVEELNTYLSRLSEHHDMPKIGPG